MELAKRNKIYILFLLCLSTTVSYATTNLSRIENKKFVQQTGIKTGYNHSFIAELYYRYRVPGKYNFLLKLDTTVPAGSSLDDYKLKSGLLVPVFVKGFWHTAVGFDTIFRRYESKLARFYNIGYELNFISGINFFTWFANLTFSWDRTALTNIRHSNFYLKNFPSAKSGWYDSSGGNFYIGLEAGFNINQTIFTFELGQSISESQFSNLIPWYIKLGAGFEF